jgi:3-methylcrotonyl-CoA carboxylase alpha subunit
MDEATRAAVCEAAVKAAKAVDYVGAGTIEFIADASEGLRADRIWFMEMNTRLQVEHPVTEAITGQDLVEWQLRVASGEPLPKRQDQLAISGWAMEARLYAENPSNGFLPSIGPLTRLRLPRGIRVDSGVEEGGEVSPHYDPMIAKLIVSAPSREAAADKLARAAAKVEVWPVRTNAAFLARAAAHPDFVAGKIDTGFIERHAASLVPAAEPAAMVVADAARALLPEAVGPWSSLTGFRANALADRRIAVEIGGQVHLATVDTGDAAGRDRRVGQEQILFVDGEAWPFGPPRADLAGGGAGLSDGTLVAPMPGKVIAVEVTEGQSVTKGQKLLVLEAMKMEQAMLAPFDGVVVDLKASVGAQVTEGTVLARVEAAEG